MSTTRLQPALKPPSHRLILFALALSDATSLMVTFLAGILGLLWYGDYLGHASRFQVWMNEVGEPQLWTYLFFIGLVLINFWYQGLYQKRQPFWDELLSILRTLFYVSITHGAVVLVAKWPLSRFVWITSWSAGAILLPVMRSMTKSVLSRMGQWKRQTVILGWGQNAREAYAALQGEPGMGFKVIGFLTFLPTTDLPGPTEVISAEGLLKTLDHLGRPHLILALEKNEFQNYSDLIRLLTLRYRAFSWIPDISGLPLLGMDISHFFSHEVILLNVRNNLSNLFARSVKRVMDITLSFAALITLTPLFLFLIVRIRQSGGTAIFSHTRVGRNGKSFPCYKFRTMVPNSEALLQELLSKDPEARRQWETEQKLKNDPRVTSIGEVLRRSSLDELPQLWNVLIGDMSLVGPRPVTPAELEKYGDKVDFYTAARPGITGLWQVSGRNDVSYETRTNLDSWYVKNWNLWYDVAIIFKTVNVVLGKRGAY